MFTLVYVGPERSDCTAPYFVELDKEYTVDEFVNTVLRRGYKEWGYIGINDNGKTVFGTPRCEYRHNKLLYTLPNDVLDKKVKSVEADGGYSLMDYLISLED